MGKTRDLFKEIRDTKGTFHGKMGSIKDRNRMDPGPSRSGSGTRVVLRGADWVGPAFCVLPRSQQLR